MLVVSLYILYYKYIYDDDDVNISFYSLAFQTASGAEPLASISRPFHLNLPFHHTTTQSSKAYQLFESYLLDRALFVVANGQISERVSIRSGVPQGAIWSPLLFDLFVRNVPQHVREALCLFYADDLTLLKVIDRNNEAAQDAQLELNQDLERLFRFGKEEWLLEFEATKSFGLTISNLKGKDLKGCHIPCRLGGHEVKEQEVLEILGFLIDNKGNWSKLADATASAARQRLGTLRRLVPLLDVLVWSTKLLCGPRRSNIWQSGLLGGS